ncbi:uncharacterized protein METZ01_LOCUS472008, partial [marine metagenome]
MTNEERFLQWFQSGASRALASTY